MKKLYKVILCTALFCIVVGFGMLVAGATQGGMQLFLNMMDNNEFAFSPHIYSMYVSDGEEYEDKDYTFLEEEVKSLDLDIGASTMEIKYEDVDEYQIQVKNAKLGYSKCEMNDGVLSIESNIDRVGVSWGKQKGNKVTLIIPKKAKLKEIELSLGAGSCTGDYLSAEEMELEIGAGNIQFETLEARKTMDLSVGAGNVEVDRLEAGSLELECEAGRCYVKSAATTDNITLTCDAGYTYMKLEGEKDSYNYDLDCSMGNIEVAGNRHSGVDFSKETDHGADKELVVECNVGSVEIEFEK